MRRLKHASPVLKPLDEAFGAANRKHPDDVEPPLGRPPELPIRAPAQGARYPSRRAQPPGTGAGEQPRGSRLAIAGILAMGLVMLGLAAAMMARDLFVPAFARAAVAADDASARNGVDEPARLARRS